MAFAKTLPRDKWSNFHFWRLNEINKSKREAPSDAIFWQGKLLTFNGKFLIWRP